MKSLTFDTLFNVVKYGKLGYAKELIGWIRGVAGCTDVANRFTYEMCKNELTELYKTRHEIKVNFNNVKKEELKRLRRTEIRSLVSDIRYWLDFIVKYGHDKSIDDNIRDLYSELKEAFKVRNDFKFLGL